MLGLSGPIVSMDALLEEPPSVAHLESELEAMRARYEDAQRALVKSAEAGQYLLCQSEAFQQEFLALKAEGQTEEEHATEHLISDSTNISSFYLKTRRNSTHARMHSQLVSFESRNDEEEVPGCCSDGTVPASVIQSRNDRRRSSLLSMRSGSIWSTRHSAFTGLGGLTLDDSMRKCTNEFDEQVAMLLEQNKILEEDCRSLEQQNRRLVEHESDLERKHQLAMEDAQPDLSCMMHESINKNNENRKMELHDSKATNHKLQEHMDEVSQAYSAAENMLSNTRFELAESQALSMELTDSVEQLQFKNANCERERDKAIYDNSEMRGMLDEEKLKSSARMMRRTAYDTSGSKHNVISGSLADELRGDNAASSKQSGSHRNTTVSRVLSKVLEKRRRDLNWAPSSPPRVHFETVGEPEVEGEPERAHEEELEEEVMAELRTEIENETRRSAETVDKLQSVVQELRVEAERLRVETEFAVHAEQEAGTKRLLLEQECEELREQVSGLVSGPDVAAPHLNNLPNRLSACDRRRCSDVKVSAHAFAPECASVPSIWETLLAAAGCWRGSSRPTRRLTADLFDANPTSHGGGFAPSVVNLPRPEDDWSSPGPDIVTFRGESTATSELMVEKIRCPSDFESVSEGCVMSWMTIVTKLSRRIRARDCAEEMQTRTAEAVAMAIRQGGPINAEHLKVRLNRRAYTYCGPNSLQALVEAEVAAIPQRCARAQTALLADEPRDYDLGARSFKRRNTRGKVVVNLLDLRESVQYKEYEQTSSDTEDESNVSDGEASASVGPLRSRD